MIPKIHGVTSDRIPNVFEHTERRFPYWRRVWGLFGDKHIENQAKEKDDY